MNEVTRIRYLVIIFDKHLNGTYIFTVKVGKLRTITYNFIRLKSLIHTQTIRIIYLALYQSIYQYGILIWVGLGDGILKQLKVNKNKIVGICLNKCALEISTS